MSKIIVTGVTGQTGSYLVDLLLAESQHQVYGVVRRVASQDLKLIKKHLENPLFTVVTADLTDSQSIDSLVADIKPDFFLNLAAQSFVGSSWALPEQTFDVNAVGVIRCLEAIKRHAPGCRFYNAGSSEEFGDVVTIPQNESHPLRARSPYGASKAAARQIVKVYRESYNLFAIQGIGYNHESERRGVEFVTRKITHGIAKRIKALALGQKIEPLELGNLEAKRDWSHAEDFARGIWLMINNSEPKEYILSSNETHSVREFIELACDYAGFDNYVWDEEEDGTEVLWHQDDKKNPHKIVKTSKKFLRPAEVHCLLGDSSLARKELGWSPAYSFQKLVQVMVEHDLKTVDG